MYNIEFLTMFFFLRTDNLLDLKSLAIVNIFTNSERQFNKFMQKATLATSRELLSRKKFEVIRKQNN